jgi:hypothetical protein
MILGYQLQRMCMKPWCARADSLPELSFVHGHASNTIMISTDGSRSIVNALDGIAITMGNILPALHQMMRNLHAVLCNY